jgi:hypothetical protein
MNSVTKGQMIKDLKNKGVRTAVKVETNELVKLEHLHYHQICKLWSEYCG